MAVQRKKPEIEQVDGPDSSISLGDDADNHVTSDELQASHDYSPPKPDYSQPYDESAMSDFDNKLTDAHNELGTGLSVQAPPKASASPVPQQNARQDLEALMKRYEDAVSKSAGRASDKAFAATNLAITNPAAGQTLLQGAQGYIKAPIEQVKGSLDTARDGELLNKGITDQYAVDEDNDPASGSSRAMRQLGVQYGIVDPEDTRTTAAQLKRIMPALTTEMKGQQSQRQTETKEAGSNQRTDKKIGSTEKIAGQKIESSEKIAQESNANKIRVVQILAKAGIDRATIAAETGIDKAIIDGALDQVSKTGSAGGGRGNAADTARNDRSLMGNPFPTSKDDEMWVLKPGHPPPDVTTHKNMVQQRDWSKVVDMYANKLIEAKKKVMSGESPMETFADLQSLANSANQAIVKGWLNGVANGHDIENAQAALGSYDSFLSFITGYDVAKTASMKASNRQKFETIMSTDFQKSKADPSRASAASGGGGSGGSTAAGPVFDVTAAANQALADHGKPPIFKTDTQPPAAPSSETISPTSPAPDVLKTSRGTMKKINGQWVRVQE
jgi:hypothetical protein